MRDITWGSSAPLGLCEGHVCGTLADLYCRTLRCFSVRCVCERRM